METARLILKLLTKEDFERVKLLPTKEIQEYFGLENEQKVEKELERLEYRLNGCSHGFINWFIIEKESNKVIGDIGFHEWVKRHNRAEIGYLLHSDFHKKGYATEAAKEVVNYAFETLKLHRIDAHTATSNMASRNILKKLGFTYEGLRKGHYKLESGYSDSMGFGLINPNDLDS